MRFRLTLVSVVLLAASVPVYAALSPNLIQGGDFETTTALKNADTYDNLGTPMGPHIFNQDADLGMWLDFWGPNSVCGTGSDGTSQYCGLGGFSTHPDVRDPSLLLPEETVVTRDGGDVGNMNRSEDPYNPGNHVLENAMFRPRFAQWVAAPAGQMPGDMQFSFDFFYDDWDTAAHGQVHDAANNHFALVQVYGTNFLPPHGQPFGDTGPGTFTLPLGDDPLNNPAAGYDGELLVQFRWGAWYTDDAWNDDDSTNGWITLDTDNPTDPNWWVDVYNGTKVSTSTTQTWDYYAVCIRSITYTESSVLKWLSTGTGDVVPTFSQAFDDINLRVSLQSPGDFNFDGITNLLDINDFVVALTDWPTYVATYPFVDVSFLDPSQGANASDPVINLLDINPFVAILTSGGEVGAIPEPASVVLLGLAAVALVRRRDVR